MEVVFENVSGAVAGGVVEGVGEFEYGGVCLGFCSFCDVGRGRWTSKVACDDSGAGWF